MSKSVTRQEQLFGIRDAEFGTLEAENSRLYPFVRAVRALVDEAKIDPTDDGLAVTAVDSANGFMVKAAVRLDGDVPDETFGVNVKRLAGQLQNKPRDTTVTLDCALPYGVLRLDEEFANGKVWDIRERVGFLDPDSIRKRPDIPELEFDVTVELDRRDLSTILGRLPNDKSTEFAVSDGELSIGATVKGSGVEEGEYHALATTDYDGDGEASALYSPDYLTDIVSGIRATDADTLTLSWSDEYPLHVEASGEYVDTEWFVAPRTKSD